ncbi:MAG: ATP-binding cassette domain-containing protein [Maritimibacter sp.]
MQMTQDHASSAAAAPAIETRALGKTYGEGVEAVRSLDLTVPRGAIYALLGPNGAGKTTTQSILTTQARPTSGSARVNGRDVVSEADAVRREIGVTFQEMVLDDGLTGRQVLDYHGRLYGLGARQRRDRADELFDLVELTEVAGRKCKTYSGGMKRRLELARALMTAPNILFLDEPTLGLDPQGRVRLWDYIRELRQKRELTVMLTTHYLDEAEELADRVAIIDRGQLVAEGTPSELTSALGTDTVRLLGAGDDAAFEKILSEAPFVSSFSRLGGGVVLAVDSASRHLAEIVTLADRADFAIQDMTIDKPSLGAVFFSRTGRQLRDGANQ